jgi:hypothetical protein
VDEETAAADFLFERVIDRHRGARHDVLVIDVRNDAHDSRGSGLTSMNLITGSVHISRRLTASWVGNRRATLWLMIDLVGVSTIGIGEVAAGDNQDAREARIRARRCGTVLADPPPFAFAYPSAKLRFEEAFVPTARRADRHPLHAWHLTHAPDDLSVEAGDLLRFARVGHDRRSAPGRCVSRTPNAPAAD